MDTLEERVAEIEARNKNVEADKAWETSWTRSEFIALFTSTIGQTQQVAFQVALLSSFLPTFILSGFIFPITSMPVIVQGITYMVPARYFLVALRAIVLKGAGLPAFWEQMVALAAFGSVMMALAALRLKREWA